MRVEAFLGGNGFPPLTLLPRDLGPTTLTGYKEPTLRTLLSRFPQPVVLVGDSGERDPEIYAALREESPERLLAIFIRDTGGNRSVAGLGGMPLFSEPAAAERDAAARGLADEACVAQEFPRTPSPPAPVVGGASGPLPPGGRGGDHQGVVGPSGAAASSASVSRAAPYRAAARAISQTRVGIPRPATVARASAAAGRLALDFATPRRSPPSCPDSRPPCLAQNAVRRERSRHPLRAQQR